MTTLDTPATIGIFGAGPLGLETALYARFLGYEVVVMDSVELVADVQAWPEEAAAAPFSAYSSPLALAAIEAQDDSSELPLPDTRLNGEQWLRDYLRPLADSDLLAGSVYPEGMLEAIRLQPPPGAEDSDDEESEEDAAAEPRFLIQFRQDDQVHVFQVHGIIDTTNAVVLPEGSLTASTPSADTSARKLIEDMDESEFVFRIGPNGATAEEFSYLQGLDQIRSLFAMLADRADLNLYQTIRRS